MVVRLLLALLIALFAVPVAAPAACHDAPMAGHAMPVPDDPGQDAVLLAHACVGCVPPSEGRATHVDAPALTALAQPLPARVARLHGRRAPPDLPPPRRG